MGEKEELLKSIYDVLNNVEELEIIEYFLWFIKEKLKVGN